MLHDAMPLVLAMACLELDSNVYRHGMQLRTLLEIVRHFEPLAFTDNTLARQCCAIESIDQLQAACYAVASASPGNQHTCPGSSNIQSLCCANCQVVLR